ncbi:hypothetical protein J2I47_10160 [Fibrella sp. HMF5335]|uniref:Outer membrane protein beta-barrel domain-containing protein n=1 Tax=Fibrella rubiginis TaxID=2817060 RepID=A0A939K190_9BACT|nr:hypothetical protein [Fibrella rubiginis]MBO0936907.1 hypothetical protein [Fibrella rubiginis]
MHKLKFLLLTCLPFCAVAQAPVSSRLSSGIEVGASFKSNVLSPSATYYQLLNLTQNKMLSIGWTSTFRTFYADNLDYTTAPAYLSRGGKTGFYALGAPIVAANLDTLRMSSASGTSLNFGARLQLRFGPLELGASADILGLTLGLTRVGQYISQNGYYTVKASTGRDSTAFFTKGANGVDATRQSAKPTVANLQLLGDNSIGTLATEVYAKILINQRVGVKLGYQWITTEYTTTIRNAADDNRRFRNRTGGMPYLAVAFPFFN